MYALWVQVPGEVKKNIFFFSGAGVTCSWEPPELDAWSRTQVLCKKMLLAAEPSFRPSLNLKKYGSVNSMLTYQLFVCKYIWYSEAFIFPTQGFVLILHFPLWLLFHAVLEGNLLRSVSLITISIFWCSHSLKGGTRLPKDWEVCPWLCPWLENVEQWTFHLSNIRTS